MFFCVPDCGSTAASRGVEKKGRVTATGFQLRCKGVKVNKCRWGAQKVCCSCKRRQSGRACEEHMGKAHVHEHLYTATWTCPKLAPQPIS
eukprot:1157780-Pelagomonas_calceolata.AAC.4